MADTMKDLARQLRVDSIRATTAAGSGHPTSSMSAADLMAVLFAKYLRFDFKNPHAINNDRFILSKGHACPVLYAAFKAVGAVTDEELLTLRKKGSRLEGHPNPHVLDLVDVATGSLGQGLANGVGMALLAKTVDELPFRTYVLMGDSETAEGSVWEAFDKASHYKLDNLTAIIDMNRLGQSGETELGWNSAAYAARVTAFGWHAIELDGHDLEAVDRAFAEAIAMKGKPTCLIAKTEKGHGVSFLANKEGWHGKPLDAEKAKAAIAELGGESNLRIEVKLPDGTQAKRREAQPLKLPTYELGVKEATRKAYGDALAALGFADTQVVAFDAEVSNSTYSEEFRKAHPDRYFEMYIAEQQMVSAAVGMGVLGKKAFASTFAAFFSRAYDQIRMAAISNATVHLCGSHAGVSIGEDGPSQMALEDLAMMRAVCDSTVLYPCDPNQTAKLVVEMSKMKGVIYLRSTREKLPTLYPATENFPIGGSKVLRQSDKDVVTVIGGGITVHEALKAAEQLKAEGVNIRVIDLYSVKPVDTKTLHEAAKATGGRLIVVEDHWAEGGLADAVLEAFAGDKSGHPSVTRLSVRHMPTSATPAQLLEIAGIDAANIVKAVRAFKVGQ